MAKNLVINTDPRITEKFSSYPSHIQPKMARLRQLVVESAEELRSVEELEETLKWGEPSFLNKHGSTIRMDWKVKAPEQYALYFKCTSKLVLTFREKFPEFEYEKNRAILFGLDDKLPEKKLKECIKAALQYHKVKGLEGLGM